MKAITQIGEKYWYFDEIATAWNVNAAPQCHNHIKTASKASARQMSIMSLSLWEFDKQCLTLARRIFHTTARRRRYLASSSIRFTDDAWRHRLMNDARFYVIKRPTASRCKLKFTRKSKIAQNKCDIEVKLRFRRQLIPSPCGIVCTCHFISTIASLKYRQWAIHCSLE